MNTFTVVGYVASVKTLKKVTFVTVGVKQTFKAKDAEDYATDFIDVSVFGQSAEYADKNIKQGDLIGIQGRITKGDKEQDYKISLIASAINKIKNGENHNTK